jgi:hypothetical protein
MHLLAVDGFVKVCPHRKVNFQVLKNAMRDMAGRNFFFPCGNCPPQKSPFHRVYSTKAGDVFFETETIILRVPDYCYIPGNKFRTAMQELDLQLCPHLRSADPDVIRCLLNERSGIRWPANPSPHSELDCTQCDTVIRICRRTAPSPSRGAVVEMKTKRSLGRLEKVSDLV